MDNLTLFRISVLSTISLFLTALLTPIATISVDFSQSSDGSKILEWVCVWCQFGSTNNDPYGTAQILQFTSFDFFYVWIPILLLVGFTIIPLLKSFPDWEISQKIDDGFAINILWALAVFSMLIRGSLSWLINVKEAEYQNMFPENMVIGELGWGAASLIIGAIAAASSAMFGFIEFQYELEQTEESSSAKA